MSDVGTVVSVPFHEGSNIEFGLLEHLDLPDVAVLDGEDGAAAFLSEFFSDISLDKVLNHGLEVSLSSELSHCCNHLCTDSPDLC